MSVSEIIRTSCCGTTCDKNDLVQRVVELEQKLKEAETLNNELYGRVRGGINREMFAKKCFMAGMYTHGSRNAEQAFLQFKAEEL